MNAAIFRDMELLPAQAGSPIGVPGAADGRGVDGARLTFAQSLDNARAQQTPAERAGVERTAQTGTRAAWAQSPADKPTASDGPAVPRDGEPFLHHGNPPRQLGDDTEPASTTVTAQLQQTVALADPAAMPADTASPPAQIRPRNAIEANLRAAGAYDAGESMTTAVPSGPEGALPPAPAAPGLRPEQPAGGGAATTATTATTAGAAAAPAQAPAAQAGPLPRPASEPAPDASGPQEAGVQVPADRGRIAPAAAGSAQEVLAPAGWRFSPLPAEPARDPAGQPSATIQEAARADRAASVAAAAAQAAPTPGRPTAADSLPPAPETGRDPAPGMTTAYSRGPQPRPAPVDPAVLSEPREQSAGDRGPAAGAELSRAVTTETGAPRQVGPALPLQTDPPPPSDVIGPHEQASRAVPESTAPTAARQPSPAAIGPAHAAPEAVVDGGSARTRVGAPAQVPVATDAARTGPATNARVTASEPATPTPDAVRTALTQESRPATAPPTEASAPAPDPALPRPDAAATRPSLQTRPDPATGVPAAAPASETATPARATQPTQPTQAAPSTPPTQATQATPSTPPTQATQATQARPSTPPTQATQASDAARPEAAAAPRAPLSPQSDVARDTGAAVVRPRGLSAPEALSAIETQQPRREATAQARAVQMASGARPPARGGGAWFSPAGPQQGVAPSVTPAPVSEAAIHSAPVAEPVDFATAPQLTAQVATQGGRPTTTAGAARAADAASVDPALPGGSTAPGPVANSVATGRRPPQAPPAEGLAARTTAASEVSADPQTVRFDGRAAATSVAAAAATADRSTREVGGPSRRPQQVQAQRTELEVSAVTGTDFSGAAATAVSAAQAQSIADGGPAQTQALARAHRVVAEIAALDHTDRGELQIDLDWEDVGVRHLSVRVEEGRARLVFTCTNPESVAHLRSLEAPIRQALEAGGMQLDDFRAGYEGGQRQGDGRWAEQAQGQPDRAQVPLDTPADRAGRTRPGSATVATASRGPRAVDGRLDVLV